MHASCTSVAAADANGCAGPIRVQSRVRILLLLLALLLFCLSRLCCRSPPLPLPLPLLPCLGLLVALSPARTCGAVRVAAPACCSLHSSLRSEDLRHLPTIWGQKVGRSILGGVFLKKSALFFFKKKKEENAKPRPEIPDPQGGPRPDCVRITGRPWTCNSAGSGRTGFGQQTRTLIHTLRK